MTNTVAVLISAALAKAKLAIAIEKVNRFPSGTPGGKGGQFAPTNGEQMRRFTEYVSQD